MRGTARIITELANDNHVAERTERVDQDGDVTHGATRYSTRKGRSLISGVRQGSEYCRGDNRVDMTLQGRVFIANATRHRRAYLWISIQMRFPGDTTHTETELSNMYAGR